MPAIIDAIRRDHRNFERLLQVLEQEKAVFDSAERPDYDILEAVIAYFQGYPACCHHPREDAVFDKLKERDPAAAAKVGDLAAEHEKLAGQLRDFAETVEMILGEHDIPRDAFDTRLSDFIDNERRHMQLEEEIFFPAAEKVLTEADWSDLDARMTDEQDPLFTDTPGREFAELHERIVRWETEDQAERSGSD